MIRIIVRPEHPSIQIWRVLLGISNVLEGIVRICSLGIIALPLSSLFAFLLLRARNRRKKYLRGKKQR